MKRILMFLSAYLTVICTSQLTIHGKHITLRYSGNNFYAVYVIAHFGSTGSCLMSSFVSDRFFFNLHKQRSSEIYFFAY